MRDRFKKRFRSDRGYAVILTALLLIPLMGFAGFAVDVGAWYARASELQRASDAASLAGVVWQPDFTTAESAARAAAARNGFTHGVDGIEVAVTDSGDNQLQVIITDTSVDLYLAGLFVENVAIARSALAEYSQSVPMGSPANIIGAGEQTVPGMGSPSNAWAGMMGHCSNSTWGDLISLATTDWTNSSCGSTASPFHDATGYEWVVDIPTGHSGQVAVQVFDAGYCTSRSGSNLPPEDKRNAHMRYTLYEPDNTPLSFDDNPVWGIWEPAAGDGCNVWSTDAALTTNGASGQWMVRTEILDHDGDQDYDDYSLDKSGQNYFALWATSASFPGYCETISNTSCPGIYAREWMPVRTASNSSPAIFYLAEIGIEHQTKSLQVSLWDPGEGMESMEILDPAGNAVNFTWEVPYSVISTGASGSAAPCTYSSYCLDVTNSAFNGDLVVLTIPLSTLPWGTFTDDWFQVRYKLGTSSVDWTTWGVQVLGDPVRLLE